MVLDPIVIGVVGFFSQFINGSLGMGFGALSASVLIALGLAPIMVSAAVHIGKLFAGLASGASHHALGNVDRRLTLQLSIGGIIGGVAGALFLSTIQGDWVVPLIAVILLIQGLRIFFKFTQRGRDRLRLIKARKLPGSIIIMLGILGGGLSAFGGAGWGPICMASLASRNQDRLRFVVGSVSVAEFFVAVAVVATFTFTIGVNDFPLWIVIPLVIGGIIAAPIAAYATTRMPEVILGGAVGLILIVLNTFTITHFATTGWSASTVTALILATVAGTICLGALFYARRVCGPLSGVPWDSCDTGEQGSGGPGKSTSRKR